MNGPPVIEIAPAIRGRVRLSVPLLRKRRDACERIANELSKALDVDRIVVRPVTGSVIVQDASSVLDPKALAARLNELLASGRPEEETRPMDGRSDARRGTPLARALVEAARGLDDDVRNALEGRADLGSLASLLLFVGSIVDVSVAGRIARVPWYSLAWYGFRSFLSFLPEANDEGDGDANGA